MQTIKQDTLTFHRAGSDFLGYAWSAHVTGFDFKQGERYTIEREDGTSHIVGCVGKDRVDSDGPQCFHLVDDDGLIMFGL